LFKDELLFRLWLYVCYMGYRNWRIHR
jgi:hypothetical protein